MVVYFSSGYDLNPFLAERSDYHGDGDADPWLRFRGLARPEQDEGFMRGPGALEGDRELALRIDELADAANRANAAFYTVDPRGLVPSSRGPGTSC